VVIASATWPRSAMTAWELAKCCPKNFKAKFGNGTTTNAPFATSAMSHVTFNWITASRSELIKDRRQSIFPSICLFCGPCNRAKSWSCEHCVNWLDRKDSAICLPCYWASPAEYSHVALREVRRLEVVWEGDEVADFQAVEDAAKRDAEPVPDFVKSMLQHALGRKESLE